MNSDAPRAKLPQPPHEYNQRELQRILNELERVLLRIQAPGAVRVHQTLNINNIPTSSAGLRSGDVWSNSGVLTIVS